MSVLGLGYLGIGASDVAAWRAYLSSVLGAQVSAAPDGGITARIDERAWRISVLPSGEDDIIFAGWEVDGPTEFAETLTRLRAAGVMVSEDVRLARERGVEALARFVDPVGVNSEVYWGATDLPDQPFVSPVGVKKFVTGQQGLGHIVLSTADPEAMTAFYRDVLNFKISDYIDDGRGGPDRIVRVTFMHGNERHHTLAFVHMKLPKKLVHFMLQVDTLDDVGFALDRVAAHRVPLALTLGRHVNDHMVSFYAWTPSGFEIEYGYGARTVDVARWSVVRYSKISSWGHHTVNPPGTVPDWRPNS